MFLLILFLFLIKVCKQIYRSTVNFIEHKRYYCTEIYDFQIHYLSNFVNNCYFSNNNNDNKISNKSKNNNSENKFNLNKNSKALNSISGGSLKSTANLQNVSSSDEKAKTSINNYNDNSNVCKTCTAFHHL